jgi:hypothetical protein
VGQMSACSRDPCSGPHRGFNVRMSGQGRRVGEINAFILPQNKISQRIDSRIGYLYPSHKPFNSENRSFTNAAALSSVHRRASHPSDTPDNCLSPLASLLVRRLDNNPEKCDQDWGYEVRIIWKRSHLSG